MFYILVVISITGVTLRGNVARMSFPGNLFTFIHTKHLMVSHYCRQYIQNVVNNILVQNSATNIIYSNYKVVVLRCTSYIIWISKK